MNKLNPALKVNRRNAIAHELANKSEKPDNNITGNESKSDRVSLSKSSKVKSSSNGGGDIASDVRYDLIRKYREILADGTYRVKANELADKIVQKIKENKNRALF